MVGRIEKPRLASSPSKGWPRSDLLQFSGKSLENVLQFHSAKRQEINFICWVLPQNRPKKNFFHSFFLCKKFSRPAWSNFRTLFSSFRKQAKKISHSFSINDKLFHSGKHSQIDPIRSIKTTLWKFLPGVLTGNCNGKYGVNKGILRRMFAYRLWPFQSTWETFWRKRLSLLSLWLRMML